MWDGTHDQLNAFDPPVKAIGDEAKAFGKPVLMLVGDSHVFTVDNPYDGSASSQAKHPGFTPTVPNLKRVIVEGSTNFPDRFAHLRRSVDPKSAAVFS